MNENHETKRNPFILHRIENERRKWGNEKKKKKYSMQLKTEV